MRGGAAGAGGTGSEGTDAEGRTEGGAKGDADGEGGRWQWGGWGPGQWRWGGQGRRRQHAAECDASRMEANIYLHLLVGYCITVVWGVWHVCCYVVLCMDHMV